MRRAAGFAALLLGAVLLRPEGATAETATARCLAGSEESALEVCEAALALDQNNLDIMRRLAWLALSNYQESRAVELYSRLAVLQPGAAEAQFDLAAALATVWQYEPARLPITEAIRLGPVRRDHYLLAAIIYEHLGRPGEAFVFHHRLARLGDRSGMFDLASDYAFGRGTAPDAAEARRWYEEAAARDHVGAMDALAEAYQFGGLDLAADEARAAYWRGRAAAARTGFD